MSLNGYDFLQVKYLVEYILSNCEYNDINELIVSIGVDPYWIGMFLEKEDEEYEDDRDN